MQCYNLSGAFLSLFSKIIGKGCRITYNKEGYWRHHKGNLIINESFPNIRLDIEYVRKEVETSFMGYKPMKSDICIDIGAGIGAECIWTSRWIGPAGKVFAVEASPFTFKILKANVLENDLSNVFCHQLAISDKDGKIRISDDLNNHIANNIWSGEGAEVDALTMDHFMTSLDIREIDFLPVNIEGAEKLLISHFSSIVNVRHVAIACHDFLTRRTGDPRFASKAEVAGFLKENGFEIRSSTSGVDYIDDWIYGINTRFPKRDANTAS